MTVPNFVIPLDKDKLLTAHAGQYTVEEILPLRMISQALDGTSKALQADGPVFLLKHFDTFFSIMVNGEKVELQVTVRALDRLIKTLGILVNDLDKMFDSGDEMQQEDKLRLLCITKMLAYLISWFVCHIDNRVRKETGDCFGKRKKGAKKSDMEEEWEVQRGKVLGLLHRWVQLPLQELWQPQIVEDSFINTISQLCYKVLEECTDPKAKTTRTTIFDILSILVKRYNHGIACVIRIVQLVKLCDSLGALIATGIVQMVTSGGCQGLIRELVREISESVPGEKDARNISTFLEAIASTKPDSILPILDNINDHLASESYTMRNCVIGMLGTVVQGALTGEDLTPEQREKRDACLDNLADHILDNHAYVRSKTLQIWQRLCCEGAVPLARHGPLLRAASLRLEDKSANVRKQALQLLRALLQSNPYAAKLNHSRLNKELQEAKASLKELQTRYIIASARGDAGRLELWEDRVPAIREAIEKVLNEEKASNNEDNEKDDEDKENESIDPDNVFEKIRYLMLHDKILEAVTCLKKVSTSLPGAPDMSDLSYEAKEECFFILLFKTFMESEGTLNRSQDNSKNDDQSPSKAKQKEEIERQKRLVDYLQNCSEFAEELGKVIPMAEHLLFSTTTGDAVEACSFLGVACRFGVRGAIKSVRLALLQVFSRDQSVRDNVRNVYKKLYLGDETPGLSKRQRALASVKALIELLRELEPGQSPAVAQLIKAWRENKDLGPDAMQVMWEKFTLKLTDTSPEDSRAALMLITMSARIEPGIITGNLDTLIKIGLGPRAKDDLLLARDTCRALLEIKHETVDSAKPPIRYPNDHVMFKEILELLLDNFMNLDEEAFISFATEAINVIYHLADQPDHLIKSLLIEVTTKGKFLNDAEDDLVTVPAPLLARLFYIVGHVAIRQLVHLDTAVYKELKRRNALREEKKGKKNHPANNLSTPTSASHTLRNKETSIIEDNGEEALGGATADDADAEFISTILENDIIKGSGLLAKFVPSVLHVCQHPEIYTDENLQAWAVLALSKMMTISSDFCEKSLRLLVTIMERSPFPGIRANILIGLTDLTTRFPNQVEPWTSHIYGRLRDENIKVRSTCIRMLSSLIMREMVRVKGQVSELALCVVDSEPQIRQDAKLFFKELSGKGNALYNIMPDIISRLSDPELKLEEEKFQQILGYILGLMQKERQVDTIIDKLCARFKLATTKRQWRDLSFCLSLLQFSGKSIRCLIDSLPLLKDKIHYKPVKKALDNIIDQTKKKVETKAACIELEEKINELLSVSEDATAPNDAEIMPPPPVPPRRKNARKSKRRASSSEDEETSEESDDDPAPVITKSSKKTKRRSEDIVSSSSSDSESETQATPRKKTLTKRNTRTPARSKKSAETTTPRSSRKTRINTPKQSSDASTSRDRRSSTRLRMKKQ